MHWATNCHADREDDYIHEASDRIALATLVAATSHETGRVAAAWMCQLLWGFILQEFRFTGTHSHSHRHVLDLSTVFDVNCVYRRLQPATVCSPVAAEGT